MNKTETRASRGVALVTGASSEYGAAETRALAGDGWRVIQAARRLDRLEALARDLGDSVLPLSLDVIDEAVVEATLQSILQDFLEIDLLFNNAGTFGERETKDRARER